MAEDQSDDFEGNTELMRGFGWAGVVLGVVWAVGRFIYADIIFEPWALIAFAGGIWLIAYAGVRDRRGEYRRRSE